MRTPRAVTALVRAGLLAASAAAVGAALVSLPAAARAPVKKAEPQAAAAAPASQLPEIARPAPQDPAEIAFSKAMDAAVAPIVGIQVQADEAALVKQAWKAVGARKMDDFAAARGQIADPVARKLVDWFRLRAGLGPAEEARAFVDANPSWPNRETILQRADEALFAQGPAGAAAIMAHFKGREPSGAVAKATLATGLLAKGETKRATELAAQVWREEDLPTSFEPAFIERFRGVLTAGDHKWRLDRLIMDDVRWTNERNERAATARRVIALLPEAEQKKANARLAVFLHAGNAQALLDALPASQGEDWGLVFSKAQQARRSKRQDVANRLLLSAPTDVRLVNPDGWWDERRAAAYVAMNSGNDKLAYDLVKEAGPLSVNPLKEQRFMAGWIAFRLLGDKKAAESQLVAMRKAADGPLSRAKASYWLGRIAEAKGDSAAAREHYKTAGAEGDTFHGLLARQKLTPGAQALPVKPPAMPSNDEIARFRGLDAVKAAVIAHKAGLDLWVPRVFLYRLRAVLESEPQGALVSHLANAMGDTQTAVRIAKQGIARGQNLITYGYPLNAFPGYKPLRKPPETAFLLGIARQETEFHPTTVSGAGAKGLLQVMTVTANHVCRDYRIKCEIPRLLTDTSYNTMIASAYIADRMDEFGGSYVLGLAGYNAGPGRARQWIKQFGDPRDPKVDPIDWIERIPFQETREYVAKVLSNVQVFRARLGEKTPLRLDQDLLRARGARAVPTANDANEKDDG